ncbi:MAG TPA: carboxypeptidase regulatory-like domain-containing protein [Pyrinomonadaceae bacterium]|nr:carboxypeptidase regulatory-like domain-containing protein [Pyrinomonadaceae bacterium]
MRYLIVVIAVIGWLTVTSSVVQACSCAGSGTPCEAYGTANAVFVGTAVSVREAERPKPEDRDTWHYERAFKFTVEQSYLGVDGTEVEILTGGGGGDCGYQFQIGGRYLVYAHSYQNRLSTSICTRTKSFASASEDLAFLGNLSSAAPGATIYGDVVYQKGSTPLPSDVLVKIEGGKVSRETRPDAQGKYRFSGLPPGKYKITLQLPETLSTHRSERELSVADRGCAALTYYVSDNGRLSGRVLDAEGQPVPRILISLLNPASDPRKDAVPGDRTNAEGRFSLSSIAPGRYLISVNHQPFPDPNDPALAYPAVFYPGVVDQANAEVITVGPGEKLTGLDIRVPLRRPESVVSGQVVWSDGSPVAKASITLKDVTDTESNVGHGAQTDEQGRFTINGYIGQKLIIDAMSNRPYVPLGDRFQPMERSEKVRITLSRPKETVKIVLTKIR